MKLSIIKEINYDINDDLQKVVIERMIREITEYNMTVIVECYVLNESTRTYQLDQDKLNEGITDIIKKGAAKINDVMMKGRVNLDMLKGQVVDKLKGKVDGGTLSKLGEIAKKNAKFVKPAMMIAVVGASLLGMDTASAGEFVQQLDGMDGQQIAELTSNVGGGDAAGGGGQAPQEDQATQYPGDSSTDGSQFINDFLQQAKDNGADVSTIINKLKSIKIEGLDIESYASKIEQAAAKANNYVERNSIHKYGTEQIISAIRDSSEAAQTAQGGAGDVAGQGGGGGQKSWDSATSSWQDNSTKITDKGKDIMQNTVKNAVNNYRG